MEGEAVPDRFAVYAGVRSLVVRATEERPVMVLVDDAHWIDAASREALLFCARRPEETRVAFVLASRDGSGAVYGCGGDCGRIG